MRSIKNSVFAVFCVFVLFFSALDSLHADWSSPPIPISDVEADSPQVAVNSDGVAIAVWTRVTFLGRIVEAAIFNGTTWGTPFRVSDLGEDTRTPQIGIDNFGNGIAIWKKSTAPEAIQAAPITSGGVILAITDLSTDIVGAPQIAVNADGNAVAVWDELVGSDFRIQAATFNGLVWVNSGAISVAGQNAASAQIAINSTGEATAVWKRFNGSVQVIQAAFYDGITWSSPVDLSDDSVDGDDPQVAMDGNGNAVAIWSWFNGTHEIAQGSTFNGSTWSAPQNLSGTGNVENLNLAINSSGYAIAAWVKESTNFIVESATLINGIWSAPFIVSTLGEDTFNPKIAIDPVGNAVAVWVVDNGVVQAIKASTLPFGAVEWTESVFLSVLEDGDSTKPDVGIDANGDTVAVWKKLTGSSAFIQASQGTDLFSPLPPPPPPPNRPTPPRHFVGEVLTNKFLTQTEFINRLTWKPSLDPKTVGYHLYQNGVLIDTIPAKGPFTVDLRKRIKNKVYVYRLTAFNKAGVESRSLKVTL